VREGRKESFSIVGKLRRVEGGGKRLFFFFFLVPEKREEGGKGGRKGGERVPQREQLGERRDECGLPLQTEGKGKKRGVELERMVIFRCAAEAGGEGKGAGIAGHRVF